MVKDSINKVLRICCCIVLILGSLFIGPPIKETFSLVNIIIYFIAIVYIITNSEKRIFANKLDVLIFIFCHSLIIPIIFNTVLDIHGTVINLLNNISVFWLYIVIKNLFVTEKQKSILLNTSIICGIFLVILGIDDLTSKTIWNRIYKYFEFVNVENLENRLYSNLGYPNSLAAILSLNLFISWDRFLKNKNPLYVSIIFIFLTGILLTYSRAMILILIIFFIIALIMLNKKDKIVQSLNILCVAGIAAVLYQKIFNDLHAQIKYVQIWLIFILLVVFVYIIQMIINKYIKKLESIKTKQIVIAGIVIVILSIAFFIIGLYVTEPLVLFQSSNEEVSKMKRVYGIKGNTKYELEFDIEAYVKDNQEDVYKIEVQEVNKFNNPIKTHEFSFGNLRDIKKLEINTIEQAQTFYILFTTNNISEAQGLTINRVTINGKEQNLKYKWLPEKLIESLEMLMYNNRSTFERIVFIKDGIKIIQKEWLLGKGTDCWLKYYPEVQEYRYNANQIHCIPLKIWMESGLVGIISYTSILIILLIILIKNYKKESFMLITCLGILLLHSHSAIDFDLAFNYIFIIAFVFIGILEPQKENVKVNKKYLNLLWIPLILICSFYCILNYRIKNTTKFSDEEKQIYLKLCPYNEKIISMKYNDILRKGEITDREEQELRNIIKKEYIYIRNRLKKLINNFPSDENMRFVCEKMEEYQKRQILNIFTRVSLNEEILDIAEDLENTEYKIRFCKIILDNKENILNEMQNQKKCRYTMKEIESCKEQFIFICSEAETILSEIV